MPAEAKWIIQYGAADATSASLRGADLTSRSLRGVEGHACRARRSEMDNPIWGGGRDKRVPPRRGPGKQVPPRGGLWVNRAKAKRPTYNKTQTFS